MKNLAILIIFLFSFLKSYSIDYYRFFPHFKNPSLISFDYFNSKIDIEQQIKEIKKEYIRIENNLNSFKKEEFEIEEGPIPSPITRYLENGKPVKVKISFLGDHGSTDSFYYLKNGKIFFVFEIDFWESSLSGPYHKEEKRYYIHEGKIIRLLKKKKDSKIAQEIEKADFSAIINKDVTNETKDLNALYENLLSNYQVSEKK